MIYNACDYRVTNTQLRTDFEHLRAININMNTDNSLQRFDHLMKTNLRKLQFNIRCLIRKNHK